jgi:hypothetical protein
MKKKMMTEYTIKIVDDSTEVIKTEFTLKDNSIDSLLVRIDSVLDLMCIDQTKYTAFIS